MKWNIEWIDLKNIEHMIAECWRMNERQLERYCKKLSQERDLVFAGELGIKFLELLCKCIDFGEKPDWPKLQKDVRLMQELIQDGQGQHEVYWKSQYQELTADTATYFSTEFGRAFTEQIAVKLELDLSEEQKMLQHDIRKIQKICTSCRWEDEEKSKKAISLLIQDEKYYFSSWLGDAFINVLQERYGKKEEDEEELKLELELESGLEPEIQPEPKAVRRSSLKAKIAWTLVVCISAGAAVLWLYMQSKDGQDRFKLQDLMSNIVSAVEKKDFADISKTAEMSQNVRWTEYSSAQTAGSEDSETAGQVRSNGGSGASGQAENNNENEASRQTEDNGGNETAGQNVNIGEDEAAGQSESSSGVAGQFESGSSGAEGGQPEGGSSGAEGRQSVNSNGSETADQDYLSGRLDRNIADTGISDSWQKPEVPDILPQYQSFYQNYPDIFGWLKIPGTEIDHPVMQSDDTQRGERYYYLHRDYEGRQSEAGSLFVETRSSCFPQDDNTVIYGHNMSNGRNFGILEKYKDKDFFKSHQTIQYDTIYETGTYQIAAVLITRILYQEEEGFRYYRFFNYNTDSEFQECIDFVKENQLYDTGTDLQFGDQLIMLSTCEYSHPNGRLVVVARKVE